MTTQPLVKGTIMFAGEVPRFSGAAVYIRLQDTALMDIPAEVIIEEVMDDVDYLGGGGIDFTLDGEIPTEKDGRRYSISVHVSMDGSDDIEKGDYITKQDYPVLRNNYPDQVTITVERV